VLARLGPEPFRREIAATEAERTALARRFGLVALDRLQAKVELVRQGQDRVLLRAAFEARFVQECVVTLDPVHGDVVERFALLYGPPDAEADTATGPEAETDFEPIRGDTIDVGEAVAQAFALALPPFPRRADAESEIAPSSHDAGPFAVLSRLLDRDETGSGP